MVHDGSISSSPPNLELPYTDVGAGVSVDALSLSPDAVPKRTLVKAAKNDSVASIAKRYRVSASSVAEWNKVGVNSNFKAGQQVVLFLTTKAKPTATGRSSTRVAKAGRNGKPGKHGKGKSVRVAKR